MRRLFVAGNWKMNLMRHQAVALAESLARRCPAHQAQEAAAQVAVCPPYVYLEAVRRCLEGSAVELGAQNAWCEAPGAFTGEVAPEMLRDLGCQWVILGHSERRTLLHESDELVSRKAARALQVGLQVILCVGETLEQRQAGQTDQVLKRQLTGSLYSITRDQMAGVVLAYEPVWAIGTGVTATTEQAQEAHRHLRSCMATRYNSQVAQETRILYGGSVKAQNARALLEQPDVDGALVGGASLKPDDFLPIVQAAQDLRKS
jgi:triosephosphate isomerase